MRKISIALLLSIAVSLLGSFGCDGSLGSKEEYGALQKVEYDERNTVIHNGDIRSDHGFIMAGFLSSSGKRNIWVLLNAKHSPYYKQVPQLQFSLTRAEFEKIKQIKGVSDTVIAVLETRIRDN